MTNKIPKSIIEKIEERNRLNEEIATWCEENLDIEGMSPEYADITDYHTGTEQGNYGRKEWCEQHQDSWIEDSFYGHYYWETEVKNKFLHMEFSV